MADLSLLPFHCHKITEANMRDAISQEKGSVRLGQEKGGLGGGRRTWIPAVSKWERMRGEERQSNWALGFEGW